MTAQPGLITLFGSGETSATGRKVYERLVSDLTPPVRIAVLETPAGFEPNSAQVAGRVADFIQEHLQNYGPELAVIPARKRGTPFSPDDPAILAPLLEASLIFLGPGSPTYAVRQLKDSLAWQYTLARHRLGAGIVLASAAIIAAGAHVLPVYEIYKVGADLHWQPGLDFFGPYGLPLAIVSHWDNVEGGAGLDTSRCYMGQERFAQLLALLPEDVTVLGIDEHTALVMDLGAEACRVMGRGGVTILRRGGEQRFATGQVFPIGNLGPFHQLSNPGQGLHASVWRAAQVGQQKVESTKEPPPEVLALAAERKAARASRNWPLADALRNQIADLGWQVSDTPEGTLLAPR